MHRTNKLLILIGIICILGLIGVTIARNHLTAESKQPPLVITVAGGGTESQPDFVVETIRNATKLAISHFGEMSRMAGRQVTLEVKTGFNSPESAAKAAQEIADQNKTGVVIGFWPTSQLAVMQPIFRKADIPVISLSAEQMPGNGERNWPFRMTPSAENQAQFLGNYARNVIGEKIVTIIHNDTPFGIALMENFEKIYTLFGTKIYKKLVLNSSAPDKETALGKFAQEIKESQDGSAIFLALSLEESAIFLKKAKELKLRNTTLGTDNLATYAFQQTLGKLPGGLPSLADYTNQLLVSLPLLFDTANEVAQRFKNQYASKYGHKSPDWIAAFTYEVTMELLNHMAENWDSESVVDSKTDRQHIHNAFFASAKQMADSPSVVDGKIIGSQGKNTRPILVGNFNGDNLVSALTQLSPIKESVQRSGSTNYLEELQQGRMLFVNDRFMYKTNVVYTGLEIKEITDLDMKSNTFTMEFFLWFRYRGTFNPEAVEFINADTPIELKDPIETLVANDLSFKLFKVKGKFTADHLETRRPYGSHVIGITFKHKTLNRNNALFVADILGMGLQTGKTVMDMADTPQVLNPNLGWKMDRAWLSQERVLTSSLGKPSYVGYGTSEPEFSRIDLGIVISKGEFAVRDFIPYEYFVYLGIFGLIGLIFAMGIDFNTQGGFWKVVSWGLRALFWPVFLVAFGNLFLDYSFQHFPLHFTDNFMLGYKVFWWVVPAMLATMALERFLWEPLERRANQAIPNVVRNIAAFLIYVLASFGITAFVFDQKLTSLLATSGLITMIVGLAVQSNIANIFSGIAVNVERPFSIGDWIKIGDYEDAKLIDITWRTMRLRTRNGLTLSLPNGKATEMLIINYSARDQEMVALPVYVSPDHNPEKIKNLLQQAMLSCEKMASNAPEGEFHGITNLMGRWVAKYEAEFWIKDHADRKELVDDIWILIWKTFKEHNIPLVPELNPVVDPAILQTSVTPQNAESTEETENEDWERREPELNDIGNRLRDDT